MKDLVSVIIPCYNRADYISECVDNILEQTHHNIEIIIVDDGSTDNTKEIVKKYSGKIKYIYQENKGLPSARNTGLDNAIGDYIMFQDSDDLITKDKIKIQIDFFKKNPKMSIVYSWWYMIDKDRNILSVEKCYYKGNVIKDIALHPFAPIGSFLFKKECFEKKFRFDEKLMSNEDWDMFIRLFSRGYKLGLIKRKMFFYRMHGENMSLKTDVMLENGLYIIEKNFNNDIFREFKKNTLAKLYIVYSSDHYREGNIEKSIYCFNMAVKYYKKILLGKNYYLFVSRALQEKKTGFFIDYDQLLKKPENFIKISDYFIKKSGLKNKKRVLFTTELSLYKTIFPRTLKRGYFLISFNIIFKIIFLYMKKYFLILSV